MDFRNKDFYDKNKAYVGFYEGEINLPKDSEYLDFYFSNHNVAMSDINTIKKQISSELVSILMQISVSSDFRGQGQGKKILTEFLSNVKGDCLLICYGDIPKGDLNEWYEHFGFEVILTENCDPIMIKRK